jgi:hypothetical protein
MKGSRIVPILVGAAVLYYESDKLGVLWFVAIPLGLAVVFLSYYIAARRRSKREADQMVKGVTATNPPN